MEGIQPICPKCKRKFKTESGLKWHLFHIHEWKDIRKILETPSPTMLAQMAVEEEMLLAAYAKGLGTNVDAIKKLIHQRFGAKEG
jgi:hypothetical protein